MGRGVAGLIVHEPSTVLARDADDGSVFCAEPNNRYENDRDGG